MCFKLKGRHGAKYTESTTIPKASLHFPIMKKRRLNATQGYGIRMDLRKAEVSKFIRLLLGYDISINFIRLGNYQALYLFENVTLYLADLWYIEYVIDYLPPYLN
jgi:hypothetical protein